MRVLFAASECVPFIKTGGLADVVGELPNYLNQEGAETIVVLPRYKNIAAKYVDLMQFVKFYFVRVGTEDKYVGLFQLKLGHTHFYFIDNEEYFAREELYGYADDDVRFGFFSLAVAALPRELEMDFDIVHAHDWQAAMLPVIIKEKYWADPRYNRMKFIVTIHNPIYQGLTDKYNTTNIFGISMEKFFDGSVRFNECLSYLKAGLIYADKITTVSPTHALELLTPKFGCGLESVIEMRKGDLVGILNGIDYDNYNPAKDSLIVKNYSLYGKNKLENKAFLQNVFGLDEDINKPLLGLVSRFAWQKGIDIIINSLEQLVNEGYQFIFLGNGEKAFEDTIEMFRNKYPQSIAYFKGYSNELAHKIYAGSDMYLMPSHLEPCGISQMIAMRYGSIPIVHQVGGLKDSVVAYNEYSKVGTGFGFEKADKDDFIKIVHYATSFYYKKRTWGNIVKQAMTADYSWRASSIKYKELYEEIIK